MKINKLLFKCLIAPWVVVCALGVGVLFILGCGGDMSEDLNLISRLLTAVKIAGTLNLVTWAIYFSLPYLAGALCVWMAKNWRKFDRLATISAALKFDATAKGGYYKLYKRGVRTYTTLNRGARNDSTKSRTA